MIEYSKDLEKDISPDVLVKSVHQGVLNTELFKVEDIRVRAIAFDSYLIAGIKNSFIHVTLKMFAGRSDEQCKKLSSFVLSELNKISLTDVTLTIEVVDIVKSSYQCEIK